MSKFCLVTGANGHLGNNLVRSLLYNKQAVRAGVRNTNNHAPFDGLNCEVVHADLLDRASLSNAMKGVDVLFQVAAVFQHWAKNASTEIINANLEGTRNVIEIAAAEGVQKIVYVSSIAALDHTSAPLDETTWNRDYSNPYYRSKTEAEELAWSLAAKLDLWMVSVLPSAIIGPNSFGHLTPSMEALANILRNDMPVDPGFHFNYVHVDDVVDGIIRAAEKGRNGQRYLLANERQTTSAQLFDLAGELFPGTKKPPEAGKYVLYLLAAIAGFTSRLTGKKPAMLKSWISLYHKVDLRCNIAKAKKELGFKPKSPEDALMGAFGYIADAHSTR